MKDLLEKYDSKNDIYYICKYSKNKAPSPTLIILHGAGSRGDDFGPLRDNPFFKLVDDLPEFNIFVPQCRADSWFDCFERLKGFIRSVYDSECTDKEHFYCMGPSMGGYGTWQIGMSMPELFAAIAPICGGGMYWNTERLKNVPVWAFHGEKDNIVFCEESKKMVDKINFYGGNAKLTVYEGVGHDAWVPTYKSGEVFKWMLSHKKTVCEKTDSNGMIDPTVFG